MYNINCFNIQYLFNLQIGKCDQTQYTCAFHVQYVEASMLSGTARSTVPTLGLPRKRLHPHGGPQGPT